MQSILPKRAAAHLASIALALAVSSAHAETVVVVSAHSDIGALSANQIGQIFLGKRATFPNGLASVPLDLAEGPTKGEFYRKVTGKDSSQLKSYWSQLIFTGSAKPPRSVADSTEARRLIASTPGMIGYINRDAVDSSVRVILTL
jgi:archaellum component FlaG (FlaF/FlaG flagellin family)